MSDLQQVLDSLRETSSNETELGTAFESLSKVFFENDSTQTQQYSQVWHYEDWAKDKPGYSSTDIGIDLVGKLAEGSGYAAIQPAWRPVGAGPPRLRPCARLSAGGGTKKHNGG